MIPSVVYRIAPVVNVLGAIVMIFSTTMLAPLLLAHYYDDPGKRSYDIAMGVTLAAGLFMRLATWRFRRELQVRDGFLLVSLVWTVLPAFAMIPFLLYFDTLSVTDAYFEAVAGVTTTGATVLTGLDALPRSINLWRCELQWLGGMGIIVLAVAILPLLGVGGMQVYKAETPGPMKESKLTPRITETAKGLWLVYAALTLLCMLAYRWGGMGWFDAVCHAFTTLSLGGFSTHDASFGHFNSPMLEMIGVAFLLIGGINFATHFMAWRERSPAPYRTDPQTGLFLLLTVGSSVLIAAYLILEGYYADPREALRHALFNGVSVITTTGYSSVNFNLWPAFAPLLMLLLSCFTCSAGSTGGGIKLVRLQLLVRQGTREMLRLMHPSAQVPVKLGGQIVPNQIVFAVLAFMSVYGASIIFMTFLLLATGLDLTTAFSAVLGSINNLGPGLNQVGPATTYASLTDFQTWVCSIGMLLGRLELFTLLMIFTPAFWRR